MAVIRERYFIHPTNGNQQAVVLYGDGSTFILDRNGAKRVFVASDRFDAYCQQELNDGYQDDDDPGWAVPSDPPP